VRRNLPAVTPYSEFFQWTDCKRRKAHWELNHIDPGLRWRPSTFLNYEAHQAPLAYLALSLPERALASLPLPSRVLILRIVAGTVGALLLLFGAERLGRQLGIPEPYRETAIFCALSCQMIWATMAHVANDWLAVPLTVWLLVAVIRYLKRPDALRAAIMSGVLSIGLLTKAYFIAFFPVVAFASISRHRWWDLVTALAILAAVAGPWYARNVQKYGAVSGMQELREGTNPAAAVRAFRLEELPAAVESYARAALWTANNTFRSFSINTLRAIILAWLAALGLWAAGRHRNAEWVVLLHSCMFLLALTYDTAINYVASNGEARSPAPWYVQVLLVPMLMLALLGTSRSRPGRVVAACLAMLFGYVLIATYWAKLIPLYAGFEGRTSLASIAILYRERLATLIAGMNEACIVPGLAILLLSGVVSILAIAHLIVLIRRLAITSAEPDPAAAASSAWSPAP
jgi:hypothetical protein